MKIQNLNVLDRIEAFKNERNKGNLKTSGTGFVICKIGKKSRIRYTNHSNY